MGLDNSDMRRLVLFLTASAYAQVTYTKEISRIVQAKCATCHRPNDIAPFELSTYDQTVTWAIDIKRVVTEGIMPPWKPVAGYGEFRDSFALTADEKRDLLSWIDGGMPKGDDADLPPPLANKADWPLGDPDKILEMPQAFAPPRGRDLYRCFVLDPQLDGDRWVSAADILPGNRQSVHHAILYLDSSGEAEKLDAQDEEPGYTCYGGPGYSLIGQNFDSLLGLFGLDSTLGGWAPGTRVRHLPDGIGMRLRKNAKIVMQVHYYSNLSTEPDRTRIGLYYSKKPVEKALYYLPLAQTRLEIPAGTTAHQVRAQFTIPIFFDAQAILTFPHMHLLGRDLKSEIERPREEAKPLIWIDNWDFNWQGPYTYKDPLKLPAFTRVRLTCTYDNSENNPRNPNNPPKVVRWGEETGDEMCINFLGVTFDNERIN